MNEEREENGALSIGWVTGGSTPSNRPWNDSIREFTKRIHAASEGVDSYLKLNIVFYVPGNIWKPDFSSIRTGRFSKSESLLMVQVPVPEFAPEEPMIALKRLAYEAIEQVVPWAARRRVTVDFSILRGIIDRA